MKTRKAIAYAYPTSLRAKFFNVYETGGFYVSASVQREDGTWSPEFAAYDGGNEAFQNPADPALIAIYNESDGEPCPMFLRFGNATALAAIDASKVKS